MLQTSTICGIGTLLYGICSFLPVVRFGMLLSAMMFVALIGDLVLLPALLLTWKSPWRPRRRNSETTVPTAPG